MPLDPRLSLAFDLYDDCELAADIGTDHAYLPIALLKAEKCRRMILTDVSPDALENARDHVIRAGLSHRAELRLGDGLAVVSEPVQAVSILGMGGRTIAGILRSGASLLQGASLLLSAHTDLPEVRRAVMEIGYRLIREEPVRDGRRFYLIMKAVPGKEALTDRELRLGKPLFESASPLLKPYLTRRVQVLEAKLKGIRGASGAASPESELLEADLDLMKRVIDGRP